MNLERKKKELELAKVSVARQELEFRILERMEDIERIKANLEIQKQKEHELEAQLQGE